MDENNAWAWYSKELQAEEHSITFTFLDWVGVHGALRIALRNPQMAKHPRQIAERMIERIEELFGEAGMTQTELDQLYWAETGGITNFNMERAAREASADTSADRTALHARRSRGRDSNEN